MVIYFMLFIGQIPRKYMFWITIVLASSALSFYAFIRYTLEEILNSKIINTVLPRADTWQKRLLVEKPNVRDPHFKIIAEGDDNNYQVSHASIAIARGRLFGVIPGNSRERDYLPQAYSDFIYAIIIEETGIAGGMLVILLYIILFFRAGIIANRCERLFPKYLVMGSALILVTQALANMAVVVNLIPVTGQPLPLISRGGTSTIINCVYIGIMLSVSRFDNPKGIRRDEEIAMENENAEVEKLLNEDLNVENDDK
jgi:cell division protein FtsW